MLFPCYRFETLLYSVSLFPVRYITFTFEHVIFQGLAADAEARIEATDPPLFLRFINLLMNDAIFLLDEALTVSFHMAAHFLQTHSLCST